MPGRLMSRFSRFSSSFKAKSGPRHRTGPSADHVRAGAPQDFSTADIHRLLGDWGRNELHSLVSEAVDQLTQFRQLAQSMERLWPEIAPDRRFLMIDSHDDDADSLSEARVEILRVQRLWKLRLELLEMMAMAQDSLRHWHTKSKKRTRK
jgi:hypothetical protein